MHHNELKFRDVKTSLIQPNTICHYVGDVYYQRFMTASVFDYHTPGSQKEAFSAFLGGFRCAFGCLYDRAKCVFKQLFAFLLEKNRLVLHVFGDSFFGHSKNKDL